jgi:hypothetical protein
MRKVHIKAEVEMLVPVKVQVALLVKADDDANIETAVTQWAKRQQFGKADIEDCSVDEIIRVGAVDERNFNEDAFLADRVREVVSEMVDDNKPLTLIAYKITDSR